MLPPFRCEHGLILSPRGEVISPAKAREIMAANRELAVEKIDASHLSLDVRVETIRIHLTVIDELQAALAQAETFEPEPRVEAA